MITTQNKYIKLTQGKVSIVDNEDFEWLSKYRWRYNKKGSAIRKYYIQGKEHMIYMHREIMKAPKGIEIDHINHNTLDNRKENLRLCTRSENNFNLRINRKNTSGYKGVSYIKIDKIWRAYIFKNNKQIHLGRFKTKELAAKAYNNAALSMRGEFAWVNPL